MADQRVAIVGVGKTQWARFLPDKTVMDLFVEAAMNAIDDAGLKVRDIDGVLCMEGPQRRFHHEFKETMGIYDAPIAMTTLTGGVTSGTHIEIAKWALLSGRCKYVLCIGAHRENAAGRTPRGNAMTDSIAVSEIHYPDYEHPYGPLMGSFYGAVAQRHMYEYGTTEEQLSGVSVGIRYNASLNPDAVYRTPITIGDVMNSRMISTPLRLLHHCMINDGGSAFIVTTEERARDLKQKPVVVLGSGGGQQGYWTGFLANGDPTGHYSLTRTLAERAGNDAFREAGVDRKDIDLFTVCDNFAITPLVLLEDYGFVKKGEGGPFIGNGDNIKVGGKLPVNPHGGMLSACHAAAEFPNYLEAVWQLRGQAGARQVKDARLALATCAAGIMSTHFAHVLSVN